MTMTSEPEALDVHQIMEREGVSQATVYSWFKRGLKRHKVKGINVVKVSDLEEWRKKHTGRGPKVKGTTPAKSFLESLTVADLQRARVEPVGQNLESTTELHTVTLEQFHRNRAHAALVENLPPAINHYRGIGVISLG